jgi:DNA polymerase
MSGPGGGSAGGGAAGGRDPGAALRARLEWLRLLGVEEIRLRRPEPAGASPSVPAGAPESIPAYAPTAAPAPASAPAVMQATLFGGMEPAAPAARGDSALPSLAQVKAPAAADPAEALRLIRDDLGDCRRCRLCEGRTNLVFGVGSPRARLMFVGEGPGADEDAKGEPFVGRAGQLLTKIIESMGMTREQVYIANVVKCRPPENRVPRPDEVAECAPFLFRQIQAIRPRVVVCLGTPAVQTVLGTKETITRLRGNFREIDGIRIMPTYHPAYLLRNPNAKKDVWEDMKKVMALLKTDEAQDDDSTPSAPPRA